MYILDNTPSRFFNCIELEGKTLVNVNGCNASSSGTAVKREQLSKVLKKKRTIN